MKKEGCVDTDIPDLSLLCIGHNKKGYPVSHEKE